MLTDIMKRSLTIACVMLLISCVSEQKETTQPKLSELATPVAGEQPAEDRALTVLYVYRFIIPLESDLAESLAVLGASTLQSQIVKNYQANGLHVGLVDMQGYLYLKDNLPVPQQDPRTPDEPPKAILDARVYRLTGANQLIPLSVTPYIKNRFKINYTSPDDKTRSITLTKGRSRFLTRISELPTGENTLEITPQHHLLKNTLMPRTPEQTILDGRVFDDLKLNAALDNNQLLVLACDIPRVEVPEPAVEEPEAEEDSADAQGGESKAEAEDENEADPKADDEQIEDDSEEPARPQIIIPDNIGAHWLLANYQGSTVQMVLIFQIQKH